MPIIRIPTFHTGQRLIWENRGKRNSVRCGRRFGKTKSMIALAGSACAQGMRAGIFTPEHRQWLEPYAELIDIISPIKQVFNKSEGSIRSTTGGHIDFWHLNDNELAGRGREYDIIIVDEGAFTKTGQMRDTWDKSIVPTTATKPNAQFWVFSTPNGDDVENFFWQCCNDEQLGFTQHHAPSWANPLVDTDWVAQQRAELPPLVFRQEIEAEFVSWAGVAFFSIDKFLGDDGNAYEYPTNCDSVFAVMDTAIKAGTNNDGSAVVYFARNKYTGVPLMILDWEIIQIEGASLDVWLNTINERLQQLAKECKAREGIAGIWVEDKASGQVLLQQARRRNMPVKPIGGSWMSLGKDERALSVSSYHYQGKCKMSRIAHDKTTTYKGAHRNHLEAQVTSFRMGDKDAARRADDLLDVYVHGLALVFGDKNQF